MKRFTTRMTVLLPALLLTVSATSCATTNQPSESATTIESAASAESTVSSSIPTEPIYPPESETTTELVRTYSIGQEQGGIPFYLECDSNPDNAEIYTASVFFLSEDGTLYASTETGFINLHTGEAFNVPNGRLSIYALTDRSGNSYAFTTKVAIRFSAEHGIEEGYNLPGTGSYYNFFLNRDGSPTLERSDGFYTFDGKPTTVSDYAVEQITSSQAMLSIFGKQYSVDPSVAIQCESEAGILVSEHRSHYQSQVGRRSEVIYTLFSHSGDPVSKCKITTTCDFQVKQPCEVHGGQMTCREYIPETVTVDDTTFENVLQHSTLTSPDGTLYLLLIYPDKADLYRINAGYADVKLTDFSEAE